MADGNNELKFAPQFAIDLDSIAAFVYELTQSYDKAKSTVNTILSGIDKLRDFPEMGANAEFLLPYAEIRYLLLDGYIVFYRYSKNQVLIESVFSTKENYISVLMDGIGIE